MLCVAQPPAGVSAASLVASALSRALGSPLRLPLEPLLTCSPEALPRLQQALFGAGIGQSEHTSPAASQQLHLQQNNTKPGGQGPTSLRGCVPLPRRDQRLLDAGY